VVLKSALYGTVTASIHWHCSQTLALQLTHAQQYTSSVFDTRRSASASARSSGSFMSTCYYYAVTAHACKQSIGVHYTPPSVCAQVYSTYSVCTCSMENVASRSACAHKNWFIPLLLPCVHNHDVVYSSLQTSAALMQQ
jgi:hypothetical protein